ncbi:MAG TPA: NAD+ synthase [Gemmatimonadaceae bacterium]|nr:NAD+ synthase [Gemmatimonadaceae bacterium]
MHLAIAQFRPVKGDYQANLAQLQELFARVDTLEPRPRVLMLPETALTGYFLEGGVRELAMTAGALVRDLDDAYRASVRSARSLDVVIGFYEWWRGTLHNSALYVTLGEGAPDVRHVHRKNFLPTYGMFDEERFVERGHGIRAFDTSWGRAAMLVCEDAWHSLSGTLAALDGAQVIFLVSAAPARGLSPRDDGIPGPASIARWERLVRDIAEEHGVFVALANLVGSEGGKLFPGGTMIAGPRGDMRARGPLFREALVTAPIDLRDISRARADMPLLADLRTALPHMLESLSDVRAGIPVAAEYDAAAEEPDQLEPLVHPDVHDAKTTAAIEVVTAGASGEEGPPAMAIDPGLAESLLVPFIRDELAQRGFETAIVALSGGVDSAVTAYLAARALGPERVIALRLPYRTSSEASLVHAQEVIDALGIESRTIDISGPVDAYLEHEPDADAARRGNVMARMRMIALFDLSARHHAIPLGTGNKTERLLGYFTWHADDSPPVNPLGDLYKTQVLQLARHLGVPLAIIEKPPTADLVQGQTDEGDLGVSYETADRILDWLLRGYTPRELAARGFDEAEVALIRKRLDGTHWKRKLPTVAMVSPTAIGESYLRPVDW